MFLCVCVYVCVGVCVCVCVCVCIDVCVVSHLEHGAFLILKVTDNTGC